MRDRRASREAFLVATRAVDPESATAATGAEMSGAVGGKRLLIAVGKAAVAMARGSAGTVPINDGVVIAPGDAGPPFR